MSGQTTAARLRQIAWGAVVCVVVAAPLLTSNPTMLGLGRFPFTHDQVELPRAVLLQLATWLALGCWALAGWLDAFEIRLHRALFALAAFLWLAAASTALSPYTFTALFGDYRHYEGFFQLLAYGTLCFVTMQLVNSSRLVWLARLMAATGVLLAAYGIEQSVWHDPADWLSGGMPGRRAFATWGNPDFFGGYLLFPLAFSVAVLLADKDRVWRIVGWLGATASVFAIVATNTRGAWFAAAMVAGLWFAALARKGYPWKIPAVVGLCVLGVIGWTLNVTSKGFVLMRVVTAFASNDSGLAARAGIWSQVSKIILKNPMLGTGPDTIMLASARYFGYAVSNDAHNYPLQIAVGSGLLGMATLYVFFTWSGLAGARQAFSRERGLPRLALTAAWVASAGYQLHLMAGLSMITSTSLLYICIGALLGSVWEDSRALLRPVAGAVGVFACILLAFAVVLGVRAVEADHAFFEARRAARYGGDRVHWAEKAVRLNPNNTLYQFELDSARSGSK